MHVLGLIVIFLKKTVVGTGLCCMQKLYDEAGVACVVELIVQEPIPCAMQIYCETCLAQFNKL